MSLDLGRAIAEAHAHFRPQPSFRAQIQQARIEDKTLEVTLIRNGTPLAAQLVRIEYDTFGMGTAASGAGMASTRRVTLFGVHGHPDIDDFDVDEWDTFFLDAEKEFTIISVNRQLHGQVQAYAEAVG